NVHGSLDRRQGERERRALPGCGLDPQPSAVYLREAAGDREPEPRSTFAVATTAAVERLEDASLIRKRDPRAVVDHAHDDLPVQVVGPDDDASGLGRELERVLEQVDGDVLDL